METIIKNMSLSELFEMYGDCDYISLAEKLFGELAEYGIVVPAHSHFKIEKGSFKSFVKKVEGSNLCDCEVDQSFVSDVIDLYTSLTKYFIKKWSEGGLFLTDINSASQYVYGTVGEETKKRIYLVDTDLYFYEGHEDLLHVIKWFVRHMRGMEYDCSCCFLEARSLLISSAIPIVDDIERFVLGEQLGPPPLGPALPNFKD